MGRAREEDSPGGGNVSEADKRGAEIGYSLSHFNLSKNRNIFECFCFCLSSCRHFVDSLTGAAAQPRLSFFFVQAKERLSEVVKDGIFCM